MANDVSPPVTRLAVIVDPLSEILSQEQNEADDLERVIGEKVEGEAVVTFEPGGSFGNRSKFREGSRFIGDEGSFCHAICPWDA